MSDSIYKRCKCRDEDGRDLGTKCPELKRADKSWNPRHGTWYFALELPPGPGGKRRSRMRRGGYASKDEAIEARDKAKETIRKGADPSVRRKTGEYLVKWLENRPDIKASTRHNYSANINTYLVPLLGHIYLGRLTRDDIAGAFAEVRRWNDELAAGRPVRKFQRHVGPAAMHRIRATLRVALEDALEAGLIASNPAAQVRMEKVSPRKPVVWTHERTQEFWREYERLMCEEKAAGREPKGIKVWRSKAMRPSPVMVWTPEQAGRFLDYVNGNWLDALFDLEVATGMRRGEICGLRWADVDIAAQEIAVVNERVQVAWRVHEDTPKSESGRRIVQIDARTARVLRDYRKRQTAKRLQLGEAWPDTGLVFTREDGTPYHPAAVTDTFERLALAAHLPPIRFHDLRHVHGSAGQSAGLDIKTMQERLGHSSSKITSDTYTSVYPDVGRAAAEKVMSVIPRQVER